MRPAVIERYGEPPVLRDVPEPTTTSRRATVKRWHGRWRSSIKPWSI